MFIERELAEMVSDWCAVNGATLDKIEGVVGDELTAMVALGDYEPTRMTFRRNGENLDVWTR